MSDPLDPADLTPGETVHTAASMKRHMASGSAWMVAMRWAIRLLGLVSTIILARLLVPDDFGLFAIAMLVIGFSELVGKAGQELAIIRHDNPRREEMDSAWTASILVGFGLGTLVVLSAPLIATVFNEPRAESLIYVLSIRVYILGFENIGVVMFRRNLDFAKDFKYGIAQKIFKAGLTVILALVLRNYWAMVIGSVAGHVLFIGLSYIVHPYRPRLCFTKIKEIWSFSGWILFSLMGEFFQTRIDRFLIGTFNNTTAMGFYHIGTELGRMPTFELAQPAARAMIPAYAKLTHDTKELKSAFLETFAVMAIICFSAAVGFALIAENFVTLVYGDKWGAAVPVVTWIAIQAGIASLTQTVNPVLTAVGKSRTVAILNWAHGVPMAIGLTAVALHTKDIGAIAEMRMIITAVIAPVFLLTLARSVPITGTDVLHRLWRPLVSALVMVAAVTALPDRLSGGYAIAALFLDVGVGAVAFGGTLFGLWYLSGCPSGPERTLATFAKKRLL